MSSSRSIEPTARVSTHFRHLDALRAVAALAVFVYHGNTEVFSTSQYAMKPLVQVGNMGVVLFYVLSGFVIFGSLDKLTGTASNLSRASVIISFWLRRFFRIYPLYLLSIVAVVALDSDIRHSLTVANVFTHLVGAHTFFREHHGAINGVLWTLGIEIQFYLVAPFVFYLFRRMSDRALFLSSLALWAGSYFFSRGVLVERLGGWGTGAAPDSWSYFMGLNQLPNVLIFFCLGFLAYRRRHLRWNVGMLLAAAALLVGPFFEQSLMQFLTPRYDVYAHLYVRALLYGFFFYAIVRWASILSESISYSFPQRLIEWIGKISFGVYIWHLLLMRFYVQKLPGIGGFSIVCVTLLSTIVLSDFTFRYIETLFINVGRGIERRLVLRRSSQDR